MATCAEGNSSAACPSPANWCIVEWTCDVTLRECVAWPRCRMPLLGCAPEAQKCVNTQFWPNGTHELALSSNRFIPIYVTCILAFLAFTLVIAFMSCHSRRYFSFVRRSHV